MQKWRNERTCCWRPKTLALLMDPRLWFPFYLPSVLTLSAFPLRFPQRLLKPRRWWRGRPAVNWLLILGFLQGQKQWRKPIPLAVLLFDFSLLSVFFLCFVLCSVWFPSVPLFFFGVPLSPSVLWFLPPSVVFLSCLCLCPVFSVQDEDNGGKSTRICCWLRDQNFPGSVSLRPPPVLSFFFFPNDLSFSGFLYPENNPFLPTIDCRCNGSDGSGGRPLQKMNSVSTDGAVLKFNDYLRFGPWSFKRFVIKPLLQTVIGPLHLRAIFNVILGFQFCNFDPKL